MVCFIGSVLDVRVYVDHRAINVTHLFMVQTVPVFSNQVCTKRLDKVVEFLADFWGLLQGLTLSVVIRKPPQNFVVVARQKL